MPFKFNPFSGNFDQTGSGGGASYIDGEVQNFSALPETLGSPAVDSAYLVREAEGAWLLNRKPAGIYIRTANTGTRASDWTYAGEFPDVFNDANFVLYDNGDSTKNLQFQLSGIATGTTRTLTAPDASGTIARTEDFAAPPAIGNTTPNSGAFTTLTANNGTLTASAPVLDLSQTWDNSSTTFTALRLNVTNTASAAASKAIDFKIGGTSVIETNRIGQTVVRRIGAAIFSNAFEVRNDSTLVFSVRDDGAIAAANGVSANAAAGCAIHPTFGVMLRAALPVRWTDGGTSAFSGTVDLLLLRDAAGTLAQRDGTNPQTFRLYNTFTSATNFERLNVRWASNELIIDAEAGSAGGTLRGIKLGSATSSLLGFYGATPVDRPATVADPAGGGTIDTEARTAIGEVIDRLQELGLIA